MTDHKMEGASDIILQQLVPHRGPWQQTASGNQFFLDDPLEEEVDLEDIATALANQCRYNGHVRTFYSVAQHATEIAIWMEADGYGKETCLAGLHHDSAEAYTGDIISQVKYLIPEFRAMETKVEEVVLRAMGVKLNLYRTAAIKHYDLIALATERRDILNPNLSDNTWGELPKPRVGRLFPWSPAIARVMFLNQHAHITEDGDTNGRS